MNPFSRTCSVDWLPQRPSRPLDELDQAAYAIRADTEDAAPGNLTSARTCRIDQADWAIVADLTNLGLHPGQTVLVHASMRSMRYVSNGAAGVVAALQQVIGPSGTIVVPTGTPDNSDSSRAHLANVQGMNLYQRRRYRSSMPAFDPRITPSSGMGLIAETVRTMPGSLRSNHPQTSFAAIGPHARLVTENHQPDCHLGEKSPLARLYDLNAAILLLGVSYGSCTAFHLAEYRYTTHPPRRTYRCVVDRHGKPRWWRYSDVVLDDRDFLAIGADLHSARIAARATVAHARSTLIPLRSAVDFAVGWLRQHRATANG
jgi:aminoglycoside 3-N-acetyltransferase